MASELAQLGKRARLRDLAIARHIDSHCRMRDWLQQGRGWRVAQRTRTAGIAAGMMSYASSWVVIWALTLAPLALVSALRETGVVFAVIIGVAVLKEPLSLSRLASVATTLLGTAILKLGRAIAGSARIRKWHHPEAFGAAAIRHLSGTREGNWPRFASHG